MINMVIGIGIIVIFAGVGLLIGELAWRKWQYWGYE